MYFIQFIPTWRKEDEDSFKTEHTWHQKTIFFPAFKYC